MPLNHHPFSEPWAASKPRSIDAIVRFDRLRCPFNGRAARDHTFLIEILVQNTTPGGSHLTSTKAKAGAPAGACVQGIVRDGGAHYIQDDAGYASWGLRPTGRMDRRTAFSLDRIWGAWARPVAPAAWIWSPESCKSRCGWLLKPAG